MPIESGTYEIASVSDTDVERVVGVRLRANNGGIQELYLNSQKFPQGRSLNAGQKIRITCNDFMEMGFYSLTVHDDKGNELYSVRRKKETAA